MKKKIKVYHYTKPFLFISCGICLIIAKDNQNWLRVLFICLTDGKYCVDCKYKWHAFVENLIQFYATY